MAPKTLVKNCECVHCQKKIEQINRSKVYWDKLIVNKMKI